jgi:hypothetical protein
MRVYVEHDMTVNHNTNVVTLKAGEIVEGPLAVYLVESNCDVTIESDDRPAPPVEATPVETGTGSGEQSHTPGSGEQPAPDPAQSAETAPEVAPPAEPGAAE